MDIFIPDLGEKIPIEKALELMTEEWCDNGEYSTQTVMDLVVFIKNLISNKLVCPDCGVHVICYYPKEKPKSICQCNACIQLDIDEYL